MRGSRVTFGSKANRGSVPNLQRVTRRRFAWPCARWRGLLLGMLTCASPVAAAPKRTSRAFALDLRQGVAVSTQQKYGQMYQSLNTWLRLTSRPPMAALVLHASIVVVNEVLVAYLQHMYDEGRPYSHGPFTLAAVQYFHRGLWGCLKSAWAALKTWQTAEPGEL